MEFFTNLEMTMREVSREDLKRKEELMKRRSDLMYLIMQYNIEAKALGLKPIEYGEYSENETPDAAEPTAEQKKEAAIKAVEGTGFEYTSEAENYITNVLGGKKIGTKRFAVGYHVLSIEEEEKEGSYGYESVIHVLS